MQKQSATQILKDMIALLTEYLTELSNSASTDFIYGEQTAYVECLELLAHWEHAEENGLDFDVEKRFPL